MQRILSPDQKRFLRFSAVGISGTIIDFSVFNLFSVVLGIPIIPSSIVSFTIAVINNFYWNRNWTYPESRLMNFSEQLIKFSVVSIFGLIIRTPLLVYVEQPFIELSSKLLIEPFSLNPEILGHNLSLAFVIVIVLFWNFFINRIWTYRDIK